MWHICSWLGLLPHQPHVAGAILPALQELGLCQGQGCPSLRQLTGPLRCFAGGFWFHQPAHICSQLAAHVDFGSLGM